MEKAQRIEAGIADLLGEPLRCPEPFREPECDSDDGAHLEVSERRLLRAKVRIEFDGAELADRRLEDTEWYGDDRRTGDDFGTAAAIHMARLDRDIARRPPDARGNGARSNAVAEWRREPFDHAVVAVENAADAFLAQIALGAAAVGESALADELRIGGVKAFDVLERESSVVR